MRLCKRRLGRYRASFGRRLASVHALAALAAIAVTAAAWRAFLAFVLAFWTNLLAARSNFRRGRVGGSVQACQCGRLLVAALVAAWVALATPLTPVAAAFAGFLAATFRTAFRAARAGTSFRIACGVLTRSPVLAWRWRSVAAGGSGHRGLVGHCQVLLDRIARNALAAIGTLRPVTAGAAAFATAFAGRVLIARLAFAVVVGPAFVAVFNTKLAWLTFRAFLALRPHAFGASFRVALATLAGTDRKSVV